MFTTTDDVLDVQESSEQPTPGTRIKNRCDARRNEALSSTGGRSYHALGGLARLARYEIPKYAVFFVS